MRRALALFVGIAILVTIAVWFASHPGQVSVTANLNFGGWLGLGDRLDLGVWRIDTSVGVLVVTIGLLAVVVTLVYRVWHALAVAPRRLRQRRDARRQARGYAALTRGFVAVAAGHAAEAGRQARRAEALLEEPALTRLLAAQAAQLSGDEAAARRYFEEIREDPVAAFLGIRGLLMQANRRGDKAEAMQLTRLALEMRPNTDWALEELFALQIDAGDWDGARDTNSRMLEAKTIAKPVAARRRAVLDVERARVRREAGDDDQALAIAKEAHKADGGLVAASVAYADLLARTGKLRQAGRVLEQAWRTGPHPDIAACFMRLEGDEDPLARLKRVQGLVANRRDHADSHAALARAALDARLWGEARTHLQALTAAAPTRRAYRMLGQLEEAERGDTDAVRRALEQADAADPDAGWYCADCGAEAGSWRARCGHCGAFDRLEWRKPPRGDQPALLPHSGPALPSPPAIGALIPVEPTPPPRVASG